MMYPSKKTYQQFISEAYSKAERQSHIKPKPVRIKTNTRLAEPPDDTKVYPYKDVEPDTSIYHNTPVIPQTQTYRNPDESPTRLAPRDPIVRSPKRKLKYSLPGGLQV